MNQSKEISPVFLNKGRINVLKRDDARHELSLELIKLHLKRMHVRFPRSTRTKLCKAHFYIAVQPNLYLAHFTINVNSADLSLAL